MFRLCTKVQAHSIDRDTDYPRTNLWRAMGSRLEVYRRTYGENVECAVNRKRAFVPRVASVSHISLYFVRMHGVVRSFSWILAMMARALLSYRAQSIVNARAWPTHFGASTV